MIDYFKDSELNKLGFGSFGANVKISRTATLYNRGNIHIGSNVRIDNFCVIAISGGGRLTIGNNVHISAFNYLNGMCDITLEDFVTLAPYVRIFSSTDDYSGNYLTGATLPKSFLGTKSDPVYIKRHSIIATGCTLMPGIEIGTGTAVGAHSFVTKSTQPFTVVAGVPAKYIKKRAEKLLSLEQEYKKFKNDSEG